MNNQWPQWTTEITKEFVPGEDQLGVEGVAQSYQQYLVPGIITTTDHARYYSFYAWVLYRFIFLPDSSRLLKDFRGPFFKRHEVALIVGSYSHHKDRGVLGGLVGSGNNNSGAREIWESSDPILLDAEYFQNRLGGFGQYYRTAMQNMGLIEENEHPSWVYKLTPRGKGLAEAYEQSIANTAYFKSLAKEGSLKHLARRAAAEYGELGCICPETLAHSKDRKILRDAFFRFDQKDGTHNPHIRRRLTLGVTLDLVSSSKDKFRREMVRPALYLGEYIAGVSYRASKSISDWAERWKLVEVRHIFTFGLQCLWATFLLHLSEQGNGISFEDYLAWARSQLPNKLYKQVADHYLSELCEVVGLKGEWAAACVSFDQACRQRTKLDEYSLYVEASGNRYDAPTLLTHGLRILCQLFIRFFPRYRDNDPIWQELAFKERVPLASFFRGMQIRLANPKCTMGDLLTWIYRELILGQHEYIALDKLRIQGYDTFKFYYRDGRFFWPFHTVDEYQEPIRLAGLRLQNALTILTDLGLVAEDDEGGLSLSTDGESYRQRVLRERSHAS